MNQLTMNTDTAIQLLMSYQELGARLHYFNGSQWYIEISPLMVAVFDTSRRDECTLDFMIGDKAENYLTSGSNCREENAFANQIHSLMDLVSTN